MAPLSRRNAGLGSGKEGGNGGRSLRGGRVGRFLRAGAIVTLAVFVAAPVAQAQAQPYFALFGEAGSRRSGWRLGWNEDGTCYPDLLNCDGRHDGFTWVDRYASGGQTGVGIAWGTSLGSGPRFEIALDATLPSGEIGLEPLGVFYLDRSGKPFPDAGTLGLFGATAEEELLGELVPTEPDPAYAGATISRGFSGLAAATTTVNFLYDFRERWGVVPTLGVGFGYSVVTSLLRFHASYAGRPELAAVSDSRLLGRSVALRLTLGAQRRVSDRFGVGLEGVLTRVGEAAGVVAAEVHPSDPEWGEALRDLRRFVVRLVIRTYY